MRFFKGMLLKVRIRDHNKNSDKPRQLGGSGIRKSVFKTNILSFYGTNKLSMSYVFYVDTIILDDCKEYILCISPFDTWLIKVISIDHIITDFTKKIYGDKLYIYALDTILTTSLYRKMAEEYINKLKISIYTKQDMVGLLNRFVIEG